MATNRNRRHHRHPVATPTLKGDRVTYGAVLQFKRNADHNTPVGVRLDHQPGRPTRTPSPVAVYDVAAGAPVPGAPLLLDPHGARTTTARVYRGVAGADGNLRSTVPGAVVARVAVDMVARVVAASRPAPAASTPRPVPPVVNAPAPVPPAPPAPAPVREYHFTVPHPVTLPPVAPGCGIDGMDGCRLLAACRLVGVPAWYTPPGPVTPRQVGALMIK